MENHLGQHVITNKTQLKEIFKLRYSPIASSEPTSTIKNLEKKKVPNLHHQKLETYDLDHQ